MARHTICFHGVVSIFLAEHNAIAHALRKNKYQIQQATTQNPIPIPFLHVRSRLKIESLAINDHETNQIYDRFPKRK